VERGSLERDLCGAMDVSEDPGTDYGVPPCTRAALRAYLSGPCAAECEQEIAQASWDVASYTDAATRALAACGCAPEPSAVHDALVASAAEHFDTTEAASGRRQRDAERATRLERLERIVNGCTAGALVCRKCGGDNIAIQQKQTRSADEGMTVFCTCDNCGAQWRMS
jgi:DNA-directed RNA polymerase subunit M/transcription elongation factor TFIIS